MPDVYTVFRCNDGHVGAIASSTKAEGVRRLDAWGVMVPPFEIVLQTTDWSEAYDLIHRLRQDSP
jgi:hypothetical protein